MGLTPKKELELRDIRQRLSNSLHQTLEQQNGAVKIRLADYPNLTLKELISEIKDSEHSVVDINETYLTFN